MQTIEYQQFDGLTDLKLKTMNLNTAEVRTIDIEGKGRTNKYKAIWNIDKNKLATIATKNYTLVQHKDVSDAFIEALQNLNLDVKGKIQQLDGKMYITAFFKNIDLIEDDATGIMNGIRLINSFDGSTAIRGEVYAQRLVCSNGMKISKFFTEVKRSHIGTINVKKLIEGFIHNVINQSKQLQAFVSEAMAESVEWDIAKKLFEHIFKKTKKHCRVLLEELQAEYQEKGKLTRWDIYNIVTAYATHGREKSLKRTAEEFIQSKAEKLLVNKIEVLLPQD